MLISFLFFHQNIYCGYSLEAPRRALLMSTHNICFRAEIRKILCGYPLLSVAMVYMEIQGDIKLQFLHRQSYQKKLHSAPSADSDQTVKIHLMTVQIIGCATVFTLSIRTPYLLTIHVLKFYIVHSTTSWCVLNITECNYDGKQCKPWSDAMSCSIWSRSTLFAVYLSQYLGLFQNSLSIGTPYLLTMHVLKFEIPVVHFTTSWCV